MKTIFSNIRWIYNKCSTAIPWIILSIIIGSIDSAISVGITLTTKSLIDSITSLNMDNLKKYFIIMAVLLLLSLIFYCSQTIISTLSYEKARNQLQQSLYNHLILSHLSDISRYHSVELLTRLTNDVETIVNLFVIVIPDIFSFSVMFICSFWVLLKISPEMALVAIIIFPLLIFISKIYGRKLKSFYLEAQKKETECNRFLQESFNNILIIKSFCLERIRNRNLSRLLDSRQNIWLRRSYFSCLSNGFYSLSSTIGYFCLFIWGIFNLSSTNSVGNFGNFIALLQLFSNMESPISGLASAFPKLISALAAVDRLKELDELESELENNLFLPINSKKSNDSSEYYTSLNNTCLTFKNVTFGYIDNKPLIDNISFNINQGETIAIIGPSGEGKTTLIKLILSLIYPTKGEIYLKQNKLSTFHRHLISYVPQGNTLFSGSILDNLTFGNGAITHDEVITALKISSAYDFVNELSNNLNTIIGEKGFGLSEGQAQRLAIARALLRKKPILILDEATSSLDPKTELAVLEQIKKLHPKPICIIITHRQAALSMCDRILKLENKKLIVQPNSVFSQSILL